MPPCPRCGLPITYPSHSVLSVDHTWVCVSCWRGFVPVSYLTEGVPRVLSNDPVNAETAVGLEPSHGGVGGLPKDPIDGDAAAAGGVQGENKAHLSDLHTRPA